jgi:hypothetical protein
MAHCGRDFFHGGRTVKFSDFVPNPRVDEGQRVERALRRDDWLPHGSYSLGETAARQKMVRLACDKCGRRGQYRTHGLLEQYGPDIAMPDLRHELAQCPHRRDMSNPCQVKYVD